jgi:hypothetical protein
VYEASTMNEIGATPKKRKPLFFEKASGGYVPATAATIPEFCRH